MPYVVAITLFVLWVCIAVVGRKFGLGLLARHLVGLTTTAICLLAVLVFPSQKSDLDPSNERSRIGAAETPMQAETSVQTGIFHPRAVSSPQPVVPQVLPQVNPELENIVRGALQTPQTAYQLSMDLTECAYLNRSMDEHKSRLERLNAGQISEAADQMDEKIKKCMPLLGMNQRTAYDLARYAANSGVLEAQLYFPAIAATYINSSEKAALDTDLIQQFKADSVRFAINAARTGSPDGLYRAYAVYSDGLYIEPDARIAHYYLSEYLKIKPSPAMYPELERLASKILAQESR